MEGLLKAPALRLEVEEKKREEKHLLGLEIVLQTGAKGKDFYWKSRGNSRNRDRWISQGARDFAMGETFRTPPPITKVQKEPFDQTPSKVLRTFPGVWGRGGRGAPRISPNLVGQRQVSQSFAMGVWFQGKEPVGL